MKTPQQIQSIEISTIAHSTEDLGKVEAALSHLLPDSLRGRQLFTRSYVEGHYNNPIVTFTARITKPSEIAQITGFLMNQLPKSERLLIQRNLSLHSDGEGNLFLRVDKQQALRGTITLSDVDSIRVKLKFSRFGGRVTDLMINYLESS